ncbi:MAG: site-specific DNA-methyltransferase [Betaproteobacteria bacterium]|nr:site-specific DNA-methyltransferase [Betaproteobacteria bacterium]
MNNENSILVGDCRDLLLQLPENSIAACITDPPYNYEFIGHKWDAGEIERRLARVKDSKTLVKNIPYGSGLAGGVRNKRWYEKNRENILEYESWCHQWGERVYRVCKPGALVAAFNSTRTMAHVQVALERAGFYARDCIVYRRSSGIPKGLNVAAKLRKLGDSDPDRWKGWHSCLRNEWEAIVVVQKPLENNYVETLHKYDVGLFQAENADGSFQSNILEGLPRSNSEEFNLHCTVKPLPLMERLIELLVPPNPNNIVLDPFAGSGTTLVAAKNLGFTYVGMEINPEYASIARRRLGELVRTEKKVSAQPGTLGLFRAETL